MHKFLREIGIRTGESTVHFLQGGLAVVGYNSPAILVIAWLLISGLKLWAIKPTSIDRPELQGIV